MRENQRNMLVSAIVESVDLTIDEKIDLICGVVDNIVEQVRLEPPF